MESIDSASQRNWHRALSHLAGFALVLLAACTPMGPIGNGNQGAGNGTGNGSQDDGLISDALSYQGVISGTIVTTQSTRTAGTSGAASQTVPQDLNADSTMVHFMDLNGEPLQDADGNPIPPVPLNPDGTYTAEGLPVGTDFTICADDGNDGSCEIESCVVIPSTNGGPEGVLQDAQADPLTTIVLAKLRRVMQERNLDPRDLPASPAAVVSRIVDAYTNLFDDEGIDQAITLDELDSLGREARAQFFDSQIPDTARAGMKILEGNLDLNSAADDEAVALAAAKVFLSAGFPIADLPGGADFSSLANLEDVDTTTREALFGPALPQLNDVIDKLPQDFVDELEDLFPDGVPDDVFTDFPFDEFPPELLEQLPPEFLDKFPEDTTFVAEVGDDSNDSSNSTGSTGVPGLGADAGRETIYISTTAEPDRNFVNQDEESGDEGQSGPMLPIINDHILLQMARLQRENRLITIGDLYDLLTSIDDGLAARLTYFYNDPNFVGPPLTVFETENGDGLALDTQRFLTRFMDEGLQDVGPEAFDQREAALRGVLRDLLADTLQPGFEQFFDAILTDRLGTVEELSQRIREARAHLPFSRTGPATFFVAADGDMFASDEEISAVTVDAEISPSGEVLSITYNEDGNGKYWLGFTERTDKQGIVQLILRETGRPVHQGRMPARTSIFDETVFQPINGEPFADLISQTGTFYPGINVTVVDRAFGPGAGTGGSSPPFDGNVNPPPDSNIAPGEPNGDGTTSNPGDSTGDGTSTDSTSSTDEPPPAQDVPSTAGDHATRQMFVLATGVGFGAEPVRVDYDPESGTTTYNPNGRSMLMFLPDSQETGIFGLFNEDTGRPAKNDDPADFFIGPIDRPEGFEDVFNDVDNFGDYNNVDDFIDHFFPPPGGMFPPPDGTMPPPDSGIGTETDPMGDSSAEPAGVDDEPTDGEGLPTNLPPISPDDVAGAQPNQILIRITDVIGLELDRDEFRHVFGTEVENPRYDSSADPYYDDLNQDDVQDDDEPTAPFLPTLFDSQDWRSTDVRLYYRRADNGEAVDFDEIAFESETPMTLDGVELVSRTYKPALNAYRFGRPNTAVNLFTAFAPSDFFNGTQSLDETTAVDVFSALSIVNLVMSQVFNIEANIDIDGLGPRPRESTIVDAHIFVPPLNDPFLLFLRGFRERTTVAESN